MFDTSVHSELKRKNKTFALAVSLFVIAFAAARMVITRLYLHEAVDFYADDGNVLVLSVDYIVATCVVLIYFISFFAYKRKKESHNYSEAVDCFVQGTQAQVFSSFLAGFLFVASSLFQAYSALNPKDAAIMQTNAPFFRQLADYVKAYPFDVLIFFTSILSSVYFFKTASLGFDAGENIADAPENATPGPKCSSAHVIFSFMPILWSFFNVFKCFFDMSKTSINSPVRIYELMTFLAISAYFVSESRILVGRRETARFFTFAYITVIIAAASALPNLIWSSFWILSTNSDQILYAIQLAIVAYIFSRIYSQIKYGRFFLQR